jgi:hypothetical protein
MNSAKGERPVGTDGSDHQARHVVENRYKLAAEARHALTIAVAHGIFT